MPLSTPVAFLIFNRPDLTETVFNMIARVKPEKLLVIADGPRFSEEEEKCEQTRAVINRVDWNCEVYTNFSDKNLGCGQRISSGIEWVFSKVEEAIFLEDDCLPVESFFKYCQVLLEHYRHNERIMSINGSNLQCGQRRTKYSYHFTRYNCSWGWASWRRAWKNYDYEMKSWPIFKQKGKIKSVFEDPCEQKFWVKLFDSIYQNPGGIDTWDHQWDYTSWSQNGLAIEPEVNLVANLGLGHPDATHTLGNNHPLACMSETDEISDIEHPPYVIRNREADNHVFNYVIGGKKMRRQSAMQNNMSLQILLDKIIELFIPLIAIKGVRTIKNILQKKDMSSLGYRYLEYAPKGWQTQLPISQNKGWSVDSVTDAEKLKWDAFISNLEGAKPLGFSHEHTDMSVVRNPSFHNIHISFAYVLTMAAQKKESVSVLDYGGSLGHYYQIGKSILPDVTIDFHVKEVPLVVETGRQINPEVNWYDDESCLNRDYDLVMITGAIPYMKDWIDAIHRISRSVRNYLFVSRLPVIEKCPSFVTIQHIYNSTMLHQVFNQAEFLEVVKDTGLTLVREFVVGDRPYIKGAPEQCEVRGWLFRKKSK